MNYEIKLYAHGVPNGQSTWGVENFDGNYIETFYGRKSKVSTQMFVEVRQFGTSTYCYYTYLRANNIYDYNRRPGSYFALTLRINYYYADIQNIYNLLDAAYNKFIVGSIISINEGLIKYLIADFTQADTTLKTLELELNKYLMQFSSDSDFLSLATFKVNGQNEPAVVNILECDAMVIANYVKNNTSISVSPLHPTTKEQKLIQKMTAEIDAANTQAQQQIHEVQQNALRDINATKANAQRAVAEALHDKEIGIQTVRNEYKESDRTISSLRREIENANKEIARLTGTVKDLSIKLQSTTEYKEKYNNVIKDLNERDALLTRVRDSLSGLSGLSKVQGINKQAYNIAENKNKTSQNEESILSLIGIIYKLHPFVDFFVMIVLLVIIGFSLPKSCDKMNVSHTEIESSDNNSKLGGTLSNHTIDEVLDDENITDNTRDTQSSLKEKFPQARIDIKEINANNPMIYGNGNSYTLSLLNVNENLDGKWVSNDFFIYDNQITPKKSGECSISYLIGNDTLVTRTIKVR